MIEEIKSINNPYLDPICQSQCRSIDWALIIAKQQIKAKSINYIRCELSHYSPLNTRQILFVEPIHFHQESQIPIESYQAITNYGFQEKTNLE